MKQTRQKQNKQYSEDLQRTASDAMEEIEFT